MTARSSRFFVLRSSPGLAAMLVAATILGFALACGSEPAPEESAPAVPIAGLYKVSGFTVDAATGANKREISGTVVLSTEGDRYIATFELTTPFPGLGVEHEADVIGKGEGKIDGRSLTGTADTQLVSSVVPGIDAGFAFIPRSMSTRLRSTSEATIDHDGVAEMTIENIGVTGENYTPTRTRLEGVRIGAAAIGGEESAPPGT